MSDLSAHFAMAFLECWESRLTQMEIKLPRKLDRREKQRCSVHWAILPPQTTWEMSIWTCQANMGIETPGCSKHENNYFSFRMTPVVYLMDGNELKSPGIINAFFFRISF